MRVSHTSIRFLCVLALAASTGLLAWPLHAATITGQIVNGTTGEPVAGATVKIINPSGGMMVEEDTQTYDAAGHFTFEDMDKNAPIYLVRTAYLGVNYTELVRFEGKDEAQITLTVYETTTSWDDVEISVPQAVVFRSGDSLLVDKFIEIVNNTSPPRSIGGEGASFEFYIPEDRIAIHEFTAMSLGVPVPTTPVPTDAPDYFTVDYPIKPGVTRIQMQFSLPYASGRYSYVEKMRYDLKEMTVYTDDPSLSIASTSGGFHPGDEVQGYASWHLHDIGAGEDLALEITGGSGSVRPAAVAQNQNMRVVVVPSETDSISLMLLLVTFVMFSGMLAFGVGATREVTIERQVLETRRNELLDQIARLDDLHQTGTVSDQMHKIKRTELLTMVAQIYYRTRVEAAPAPESVPPTDKEKGAARV